MRAVELRGFGRPEDVLAIIDNAPEPTPHLGQILVRVVAASLNRIDGRRCEGYGRVVFRALGAGDVPLVLGRDCSGIVTAVGAGVRRFKPGDAVWAALDSLAAGTHADHAVVDVTDAALKPATLSHEAAAALPYVGLTAWAALVRRAGLTADTAFGRRVLVHGGAGGVGSFAVQLLKAWGAEVITTCGTKNVEFVRGLGADRVIDYKREDFSRTVRDCDVVLDVVGGRVQRQSLGVLKPGGCLVTIVTPALALTDRFGLAAGLPAAAGRFVADRLSGALMRGRRFEWAYFEPDGAALAEIGRLVEAGTIRPVIERVYPLDEIVAAYRHLDGGVGRGKIVVRVAPDEAGTQAAAA